MFGVGRVCFIVGISKTIRSIINIIRQSLWATNTVCGFVVCLGFPFAFKKQQQQQQRHKNVNLELDALTLDINFEWQWYIKLITPELNIKLNPIM